MLTRQIEHRIKTEGVLRGFNYPAANTAAVITLSAKDERRHVVHFVQWSYSAAPTGGKLTITRGGVTEFDVDITAAGPGGFNLYFAGKVNEAVVITLAAGGAAIVGKLNAQTTEDAA